MRLIRSSRKPIAIVTSNSSPIASRPIATTREKNQSRIEMNAMTPSESSAVHERAIENEIDVEHAQPKDGIGDANRHQHDPKPTTCPTANGTPGT